MEFFRLAIDVFDDLLKVVVEPSGSFLAVPMNLVNDWIGGSHGYLSINSPGVQMSGGSYCSLSRKWYTRRRITAFARCLQFQVSK